MSLENTLQEINAKIVRLCDSEKTHNNTVIRRLLDDMVVLLKDDPLFKELFESIFYGGSFYDNLKVKKPDEYDIDFLLVIPTIAKPEVVVSNKPGYANVKINDLEKYEKQKIDFSGKLSKLLGANNFLSISKVNSWWQGIVQKALNRVSSTIYEILGFKKSGPAATLKVKSLLNKNIFDVDLVPCFCFNQNNWPKTFRQGTGKLFLISKSPSINVSGNPDLFWRISFQMQERNILEGKNHLKPAIRLAKVLRDKENWKSIKSYFIKTAALWVLENDRYISNASLSSCFLKILKQLEDWLNQQFIPSYWQPKLNLIVDVDKKCIENMANRLTRIIKKIQTTTNYSEIIELF